jgi:hypothetical protein
MSITYTITYVYSNLDKEPQFGLETNNENEVYNRWVYFYLGELFGGNKPTIYQFELTEMVFRQKIRKKTYKYCNDAKRQAKLIYNYIIKIYDYNRQI